MTEEAKLVYLQIDMPKFVWVTEISDKKSFLNNKVNCLILLDATGSNIDNEGYSSLLFYQKRDVGTFFNKKIGGLRIFLYLCRLYLRLLMTT